MCTLHRIAGYFCDELNLVSWRFWGASAKLKLADKYYCTAFRAPPCMACACSSTCGKWLATWRESCHCNASFWGQFYLQGHPPPGSSLSEKDVKANQCCSEAKNRQSGLQSWREEEIEVWRAYGRRPCKDRYQLLLIAKFTFAKCQFDAKRQKIRLYSIL